MTESLIILRENMYDIFHLVYDISYYGYSGISNFESMYHSSIFYETLLFGDGLGEVFFILLYLFLFILSDIFLFFIGKFLFTKYRIKKFKNIYLYVYIFKFIPFLRYVGSILLGMNTEKNTLKHIFISNILFIIIFYTLYFSIRVLLYFTVVYYIYNPGEANGMTMHIYENLNGFYTSIILFLIGIYGTIGYYLGKKKSNF